MAGTELAKAYVQIIPSAQGISGKIQQAIDPEAEPAGASFGGKLVGKLKGIIATAAIGKALGSAISEGANLEQSLGGIETLFKDSADKVKANAAEAYRTAGMSANEYMELTTSFSASLLSSLSNDTSKAADVADMAMTDMSDNANKMGTNMEDIRDIGWACWQSDGRMSGTTGQNRRIEAFRLIPVGETDVVVHIKDVGDKEYKNISKDTILGTTGQNKRIEAIKITGKDTPYIYRVHQKNIGWTDWTFNGNWAGTKGKGLQIEAIEIMTAKFLVNPHVQNRGWLGERACENIIGITGHNLRLEAFKINPLGTEIKAKAHIQGIGWEYYGVIKKDTIIGTVGEGKRLECLCFEGDFEYRVHVQNSGWTDWTKADGVATMGTVGQALRIEAIQFR